MATRKSTIQTGIGNCQTAMSKAIRVRDRATDPQIRELAEAIRYLSYGAQQIGLGNTDSTLVNDLPR